MKEGRKGRKGKEEGGSKESGMTWKKEEKVEDDDECEGYES